MKTSKINFKILSTKKCSSCGRFLKQNLVDRNPEAELCYKCWKKTGFKDEQVTCKNCDGAGDIIDHSKINCRSIDVPYKICPECCGSGVLNS